MPEFTIMFVEYGQMRIYKKHIIQLDTHDTLPCVFTCHRTAHISIDISDHILESAMRIDRFEFNTIAIYVCGTIPIDRESAKELTPTYAYPLPEFDLESLPLPSIITSGVNRFYSGHYAWHRATRLPLEYGKVKAKIYPMPYVDCRTTHGNVTHRTIRESSIEFSGRKLSENALLNLTKILNSAIIKK